MLNLLEVVYEYQSLGGSEDEVRPRAKAQRAGIERLLKADGARRNMRRLDQAIPVQFTRPGGFASGEIVNMSGGGVAIAATRVPAPGTRLVLRVADPIRGWEYVFPGIVAWAAKREMGVAFDGVPARSTYLLPVQAPWRREMRLGRGAKDPLVA